MPPKRNAFEVELRDGLTVVLAEITPSEMLLACKLAGNDPSELVAGSKVTRTALRMSVREVAGKPVAAAELDGSGWGKVFPRTRHVAQLAEFWGRIHTPSETEIEALKASMVCELDGDGERWSFTLPGGLVVVMAEVPPETVDDALRAGQQAAKSAHAQAIAATIESGRRAIRAIGGKPVTAADLAGAKWDAYFSVKLTALLGVAFSEIHGSGADGGAPGELKPISSTP